MKTIITLVAFAVVSVSGLFAQSGSSCNIAEPFCTGVTYAFPMGTNTVAESGPNYGCLYSQPNPYWYFLKILDPGNITIQLNSPTGNDIDFAIWGPFSNPISPCTAQLTASCSSCPNNTSLSWPNSTYPAGNLVDCSYDPAPSEIVHISNAITGQYYLLLITNYSNSPGNITFSQSNAVGTPGVNYGTTDCSIINPCDITNITVTVGACNPANNTYSISGTITYNDAPTTGTLGVTVSGGGSQTINGPFGTSSNYSITGLVSDGASHTITATFSDDPFCTYTVTYTAPNPCSFCFANAGADFTVCGLSTPLAGVNDATNTNQTWSCLTPGVFINQQNQYNTVVTVPSAGTYTFTWTITNASGLTCYDDVVVTFNPIPTSTFTAGTVACFTSSSAVNYTGTQIPGATYTWNFDGGTGGGTGPGPYNITWATAGNHNITLTVTANGCTSTQTTQSVNVPTQLQVNVATSNVTCASGTNGQANVNVSGGTPAYGYAWSNTTGPPFAAGPYTVTITDANLCTANTSFTITEPNSINIIPSQTNVACYNGTTGSASVAVSGGTSPYNYSWSPGGYTGNGTSTYSNLPAGTYTVTISDANICTTTNTITITQPAAFTASVMNQINPACQGVCNGSAAVQANGGSPGYTYAWPGGQTTFAVNGLCSGSYVVTITDSQNCTATTTVTLTDPAGVTVTIPTTTNVSCFGQCNGSATASPTGGSPGAYNYLWSNGANGQTASNLCLGNITVTVSDVNGCTASANATISEPTQLTLAAGTQTGVLCYGDCNGVGSVNPAGGTPPYQYYWSGSAFNQQTNPNLCAASHFVTVTDANGCTASTMVVIPGPSELVIQNINATPTSCNGISDGTVTITVAGGYAAYTYQLGSYTQSTNIFTGLAAGNYGVTVTDANNCTKVASITVNQPNPITIASSPSFTLCNGQTGFIQTVVTGGTQPYTYYWNGVPGQSIMQVNPQQQVTYNVQVTDANGCTSNTASTTVNVTPPVQLDVFASPAAVCPGDPVMLNVSITQGAGEPYIVRYEGQIVVPPVTVYPNQTGYYELSVEDNCGSTASDTVLITVYPVPVVTFTSDTNRGCQPLEVHFNQYSSVPGISYIWNFGDNSYDQISYDVNPTHKFRVPGTFDVSLTVTSINGCVSTTTIPQMITVWPKPDSRFDADPQIVSIIKPQIQFINLSTGADWYIWHFGDGDSASITHPLHLYHSINTFNVSLIAITNKGCKDTSYLNVTVRDEYSFYAPSAFSPNNDWVNDAFYVIGHGIDVNEFYLAVYDRWGNIMFETDKYNPLNPEQYGWRGTTVSKQMAPIGTYTWLCKYKDGMNILHEKAGTVTLIR